MSVRPRNASALTAPDVVCHICRTPAHTGRVMDGNSREEALAGWAPRMSRSHGPEGREQLLVSCSARAPCLCAGESDVTGGPHAGGMDERARPERRATRAPARAGSPCTQARQRAAGSSAGAPARRRASRRELISSPASRPLRAAEERADGAPRSSRLGRNPRRRARPSREPLHRRGRRADFGATTMSPHGPRPVRRGRRSIRRSRRAGRQRGSLGGRSGSSRGPRRPALQILRKGL